MNSRAPTRYQRREADRIATAPPPQRTGPPEPTPPDACPSHHPLAPCLCGLARWEVMQVPLLREDRCAASGPEWGMGGEDCPPILPGGGLAMGLAHLAPCADVAEVCVGGWRVRITTLTLIPALTLAGVAALALGQRRVGLALLRAGRGLRSGRATTGGTRDFL